MILENKKYTENIFFILKICCAYNIYLPQLSQLLQLQCREERIARIKNRTFEPLYICVNKVLSLRGLSGGKYGDMFIVL